MISQQLYITSHDSSTFKHVTKLDIVKNLDLREENRAKLCWLVQIFPALIGQPYGLGDKNIDYLILTPRHQGVSLDRINEFPIYVHILLPKHDLRNRDVISIDDFSLFAWGEIIDNVNMSAEWKG